MAPVSGDLLSVGDQFLILKDLSGSSDEWDKLGKLMTELFDTELVNDEEKICLRLLGKTSPIKR